MKKKQFKRQHTEESRCSILHRKKLKSYFNSKRPLHYNGHLKENLLPKKGNKFNNNNLFKLNSNYYLAIKENPNEPKLHIKLQRKSLPIYPTRKVLLENLKINESTIVIGETGSGKTTQIPQFLYEDQQTNNKCICITQPRRVAAISIAKRVADEMNVTVGGIVGYCVRFEEACTAKTKIKYVTDGLLLREAMSDPLLSIYSWIILDEAHERSLNTDILFGIVKKAQQLRKSKEPLRVCIMSATMDVDHFSQYFNNAKILYIEGRQYPVEIFYSKEKQDDYVLTAIRTIFQIHRDYPANKDILVFLTGQDEIESATYTVRQIAKNKSLSDCPKLKVYPLYASLPAHQQLDALRPSSVGERKVIISTNIAETSLTIPGISFVVDAGHSKIRTYNSYSGFDALKVCRISKAQAWQRSGRSGREAAGICYRAYTLEQYREMPENPVPEILRINLAGSMLQLMNIGVKDVFNFDFIDKPLDEDLIKAQQELISLEAIEIKNGKAFLTETGRKMAKFPLHPRLSKVLLTASENGCTGEVLTIVSVLSGEAIFVTPSSKKEEARLIHGKFFSNDGDLVTYVNIMQEFCKSNMNKHWCVENFLHHRNLRYACEVRKQLVYLCHSLQLQVTSCNLDYSQVIRCFVSGFFMNVAELQIDGKYIALQSKHEVAFHPSSCLFGSKPNYVLFIELLHTAKTFMNVNSVVDAQWLVEAQPDYFRDKHIKR